MTRHHRVVHDGAVPGDILEQIDSSINDAREQFCACGCGAELRADGPSFYYATQECQARAMRSAATDPDAVERRTDYSYYTQDLFSAMTGDAAHVRVSQRPGWFMYRRGDAAHAGVSHHLHRPEPRPTSHAEVRAMYEEQVANDLEQPLPLPRRIRTAVEIPEWLMYQRDCEHCGQCLPPLTETEYEDIRSFGSDEPVRSHLQADIMQSCPACGQRHVRPVVSIIQRTESGWWLRLDDRTRWVGHMVTDLELEHAIEREFLVRAIWRDMTTDLFGPAWRPTTNPSPAWLSGSLPMLHNDPGHTRGGYHNHISMHRAAGRAIDIPIALDDAQRAWIEEILDLERGQENGPIRAWLNGLTAGRERPRAE